MRCASDSLVELAQTLLHGAVPNVDKPVASPCCKRAKFWVEGHCVDGVDRVLSVDLGSVALERVPACIYKPRLVH